METIFKKVTISTEWDVIQARITVRQCADRLGFNVIDNSKIEIVVSELARNIIKYAYYGFMTIEEVSQGKKVGLKIISIDEGDGIENIELALMDGFSTSNSLGYGLPSVKRFMDEFEIESEVGKGTKVCTLKWVR